MALNIKGPCTLEVWAVPTSLDPVTPGAPKPSPEIQLLVSLGDLVSFPSDIGKVQKSLVHYSPTHQGKPKMLD